MTPFLRNLSIPSTSFWRGWPLGVECSQSSVRSQFQLLIVKAAAAARTNRNCHRLPLLGRNRKPKRSFRQTGTSSTTVSIFGALIASKTGFQVYEREGYEEGASDNVQRYSHRVHLSQFAHAPVVKMQPQKSRNTNVFEDVADENEPDAASAFRSALGDIPTVPDANVDDHFIMVREIDPKTLMPRWVRCRIARKTEKNMTWSAAHCTFGLCRAATEHKDAATPEPGLSGSSEEASPAIAQS